MKWACPKCGAEAQKCGRGKCMQQPPYPCEGLLCECEDEGGEHHGTSFEDPCDSAACYHCGWGGELPVKPKGLQPWEKKALAAGWTPPEQRKKELGL